MLSKKRVRRRNWTPAEEVALITLWKERYNQLRLTKKHAPIHKEIASHMKARGYHYNESEVKIKLHNITNRYKLEKKMKKSTWHHFDEVHQMFESHETFSDGNNLNEAEFIVKEEAFSDNEYDNILNMPSQVSIVEDSVEQRDHFNVPSLCRYTERSYDSGDNTFEEYSTGKTKTPMNKFQRELLEEVRQSHNIMKKCMQDMNKTRKDSLKCQNELLNIEIERNNILKELLAAYKANH